MFAAHTLFWGLCRYYFRDERRCDIWQRDVKQSARLPVRVLAESPLPGGRLVARQRSVRLDAESVSTTKQAVAYQSRGLFFVGKLPQQIFQVAPEFIKQGVRGFIVFEELNDFRTFFGHIFR